MVNRIDLELNRYIIQLTGMNDLTAMLFADFISIEMSGPFEPKGRLHSTRFSNVHKGMVYRLFVRAA